jgi:hypothetical protein
VPPRRQPDPATAGTQRPRRTRSPEPTAHERSQSHPRARDHERSPWPELKPEREPETSPEPEPDGFLAGFWARLSLASGATVELVNTRARSIPALVGTSLGRDRGTGFRVMLAAFHKG